MVTKTVLVILVFRVHPLHALSCHYEPGCYLSNQPPPTTHTLLYSYRINMTTFPVDKCIYLSATVSERCANSQSLRHWRACVGACIYLKTAVSTVGDSCSLNWAESVGFHGGWRMLLSTSCLRWKPVFESNNSIVGFFKKSMSGPLLRSGCGSPCWMTRHPQLSGIQLGKVYLPLQGIIKSQQSIAMFTKRVGRRGYMALPGMKQSPCVSAGEMQEKSV